MSTRSQIGFYSKEWADKNGKITKPELDKPDVLIYRHWDGYPAGVLPDIIPFLVWFSKSRGLHDTEYAGARLLQYLCNQADEFVAKEKASDPDNQMFDREYNKKFTGTLGHGICNDFHLDIEYYYAIDEDKIEVFELTWAKDWEKPEPFSERSKKIMTIKFADLPDEVDEDWVKKNIIKEK